MAISPSSTTSSPLFSCVWPSLLNSFLIRAENHHLPPLISSSLDNHHHLCPSWLSPPPSLGFSPVRNQQWHYPASSVQWAALSLPASFRLVTITISGFLLSIEQHHRPFSFPASGQLQHDHLSSPFPALIDCCCCDQWDRGCCWWPGVEGRRMSWSSPWPSILASITCATFSSSQWAVSSSPVLSFREWRPPL